MEDLVFDLLGRHQVSAAEGKVTHLIKFGSYLPIVVNRRPQSNGITIS